MEGLEIAEIKLSICENIIDFRIDANTYKKNILHLKTQSINLRHRLLVAFPFLFKTLEHILFVMILDLWMKVSRFL